MSVTVITETKYDDIVSNPQFANLLSGVWHKADSVASATNLKPFENILSSGSLTVGRTYQVISNTDADWSNAGDTDNSVGDVFTATGQTPTAWGSGSLAEMQLLGATIDITDSTTIETISKRFLFYGSVVKLIFAASPKIKNEAGTSGDDCEILLDGGTVTATPGSELVLQLRDDNKWHQVGGKGSFATPWQRVPGFTATPASSSTITVGDLTKLLRPFNTGLKYKLTRATWQASTSYSAGDIIQPTTENGFHYMVSPLGGGTSGASEPSWGTTLLGFTSDSGVTWICIEEYYRGIITALTSSLMTIGGVSLRTGGAYIEELYYCKHDNIAIFDPALTNDIFDAVDTDILPSESTKRPIKTQHGFLVYEEVWAYTVDTGATKASLKSVDSSGNLILGSGDGIEWSTDATWNNSGVTANPAYYKLTGNTELRKDISQVGTNKDTDGALFMDFIILI